MSVERDPLKVTYVGDLVPERPEPAGPPPGVSEEEWAVVPPERKATVSRASHFVGEYRMEVEWFERDGDWWQKR